jgi:hypothetical protein
MHLDVPAMSSFKKPPIPPGLEAWSLSERQYLPPESAPIGASIHQISTDSMFMLKASSTELLRLICDTHDRS